MATTAENPDGSLPTRFGWVEALRQSLDRPLTSYYLLVGASGLLLVLGLVMVLSSSSVWSYENFDGNSYAVFVKQLTCVECGSGDTIQHSRSGRKPSGRESGHRLQPSGTGLDRPALFLRLRWCH